MKYETLGYKILMGIGVFSLFIIIRMLLRYYGTFSLKEGIFLIVYTCVAIFCLVSGKYMLYKIEKRTNPK